MKLITRDTDYAIRALCYIARHDEEVVSVAQLVEALHIPKPFLRKLLQCLNKKSILKSYKGQGGGFLLAQPAEKIFLTDLMRIFQGRLQLSECVLRKLVCPHLTTCTLRKKVKIIEKDVFRDLKEITVASLIR